MKLGIGDSLGPYRITGHLAGSASADVYRAYQANQGRDVVLRVPSADLRAQADYSRRFLHQARAAARLHHSHIVPVLDYACEGDSCYLVREHVPGQTLEQRLQEAAGRGERLPAPEVLRIVQAVAAALDYAHRHGVVHGSLKPGNILFDPDDEPVLADFGASIVAEGVTFEGWLREPCSPAYLSPEQCRGQPAAPASDVYALGVVLYELATGQRPFVALTPLDVAVKQISDAPPPPRAVEPDLAPGVEAVILKAMAKDPAARYATAGELAAALAAALSEAEGASRPGADLPTMPDTGLHTAVGDFVSAVRGRREEDLGGRRGYWAQLLALLGAGLALVQYLLQVFDLINRPLAPLMHALPYVVLIFFAVAAVVAVLVLARPAPRRQKRIAAAALGVIAVASLAWGGWRVYDAGRPPKAVIILVAEFQGQEATRGVDWARRIYVAVKDQVSRMGLEDRVEVRRVFVDYESSEQARAAGEAQKATLVLWGWYDDLGVSPHFEILRSAREYSSALAAPPIDLVDFDLYARSGPQEMGYIVGVVLGLVRYTESDYSGAVNLFSAAIAGAPEVSGLQGQEVGYFYRGVARLSAHEPVEAAIADLQEAVRRKPDMYQGHWGLAIAYTGHCTPTVTLDAALAEAQTVVSLRPEESRSHWLLGQIYTERQEWEPAAAAYREALRLDAGNGDAYAGLARTLEELGRPDEARAAREQALEVREQAASGRPQDPADAQDELGTALFNLEQYEQAIAAYKEAIRLQPGVAAYYRHLAGAYYWQHRTADGGSPQALETAIGWYQQALQLDPYDALAYTQLAGAYRDANRPEDALRAYEDAVRVFPCDADAVFLLANQYSDLGRDTEAEEAFRRVTELRPSMAMAWQYLATAAYLRGEYADAADKYRTALQATPDEADLHYGLASTLYALGDYAGAEAGYRQASELAPDDAPSLVGWGDALAKLGRTAEAIEVYHKALALDRGDAVTWVSLGLQYELLQDWAAAEEAYAEAVALAPEDALVHSARGRVLWQLGRTEDGLAEYEQAASLAPDVEPYQEALALGYAALNRLDAAVAAAEATLRLNPQNPMAHLVLGGVAEDRGDVETARAEYRLAREYAGANAGVKDLAEQGLARLGG